MSTSGRMYDNGHRINLDGIVDKVVVKPFDECCAAFRLSVDEDAVYVEVNNRKRRLGPRILVVRDIIFSSTMTDRHDGIELRGTPVEVYTDDDGTLIVPFRRYKRKFLFRASTRHEGRFELKELDNNEWVKWAVRPGAKDKWYYDR